MSLQWMTTVLMVLLVLTAPCYAEDEFLEPEEAFRFSARLDSPEMLEVRYTIADGYYMYRDRYRFEVEAKSIVLGSPQFPPGQWHEDEFFGRSEIYRGQITIRIPIVRTSGGRQTLRLLAVSQGCADDGICYLPTTQTMDFEMLGSLGDRDRTR